MRTRNLATLLAAGSLLALASPAGAQTAAGGGAAATEAAQLDALQDFVRRLTEENARLRAAATQAPPPAANPQAAADLTAARDELAKANARAADLERQLAAARADATAKDEATQAATQRADAAAAQAARLRDGQAAAERELAALRQDAEALAGTRNELADATGRAKDLEAQLARAQADARARDEATAAEKQRADAAAAETARLQEAQTAAERELAALRQDAEALARTRDQLADATGRAKDLEAQLAAARADATAKDEATAAEKQRADAAAAESARLRDGQGALERQVADLREEVAGRDREMARLRAEALAARNDLGAAEGQLQAKRKEADALAAAGRELVEARKAAAAATAATRERLAAAEADAQRQREEALALRDDLSDLDQQLRARTEEAETAAADRRALETAKRAAESEVAGLRQRLAQAQADPAEPEGRVTVAAATGLDEAARPDRPGGGSAPSRDLVAAVREALGPEAARTSEDGRLVLPMDFNFRSASAVLPPEEHAKMVAIGRSLAETTRGLPPDSPWILQVEGHSDRTPTGGRVFKNNRALSTARAVSVLDALAEGGMPMSRLAAVGYGATRPIDPSDSAEAYARNRRIELRVTQD